MSSVQLQQMLVMFVRLHIEPMPEIGELGKERARIAIEPSVEVGRE